MRIGLVIGLHGESSGPPPAPSWALIREQAQAAERAGFDRIVLEDALQYRADDGVTGYWESVSMAAALAAATSTIEIGHSVLNAPYRSPALVARMADTVDEIAGGRFFLGLGRGNTPDYDAFGFEGERKYSRFAEALEIIDSMLRRGEVDFSGEHHFARGAVRYPRGPHESGPPIVIAARGEKMLRLAARYADEWNWWAADEESAAGLPALVAELERACEEVDRDPASIRRSLDVYSVNLSGSGRGSDADGRLRIGGSAAQIAERLLQFGEVGFDEVRTNLAMPEDPLRLPLDVEAMHEVVELLHAA